MDERDDQLERINKSEEGKEREMRVNDELGK